MEYKLSFPFSSDDKNIDKVVLKTDFIAKDLLVLDRYEDGSQEQMNAVVATLSGLTMSDIDLMDSEDINDIAYEFKKVLEEKASEPEIEKLRAGLKLEKPVKWGEELVKFLEFRRFNGKMRKEIDKVSGENAKIIKMISLSTGKMQSFIERMSISDFKGAREVVCTFFGSSRR